MNEIREEAEQYILKKQIINPSENNLLCCALACPDDAVWVDEEGFLYCARHVNLVDYSEVTTIMRIYEVVK